MFTKILALVLVGLVVGRVLFRPRLRELGRWFNRFVDVSLVVLAVVYGAQLLMMLSR